MIYLRPDLVDDFYYRFTTPPAQSMILGTSRAAQGIRPDVLNENLCNDNNRILNHAFAVGPSNYGPNYLKEVKKKIDSTVRTGIYILAVDPWSISTDTSNRRDDPEEFFEYKRKLFVGNLKSSTRNPNFEYLMNYWTNKFSPFIRVFKTSIGYDQFYSLHPNGWLEVRVPMDSASIQERISMQKKDYSAKDQIISMKRVFYLEETVRFLKEHGDVYLVRLPVSREMAEIEKVNFPEFDSIILDLSRETGIAYFNFIEESGKYRTTDIHHLYSEDAGLFTSRIIDSIKKNKLKFANTTGNDGSSRAEASGMNIK